jgi:hypothetical protein
MHITRYKLALALMAAIFFGYGIRVDSDRFRWIGFGLLFAAFLLRFVKRRERDVDR